jgi:hypothetical protein
LTAGSVAVSCGLPVFSVVRLLLLIVNSLPLSHGASGFVFYLIVKQRVNVTWTLAATGAGSSVWLLSNSSSAADVQQKGLRNMDAYRIHRKHKSKLILRLPGSC